MFSNFEANATSSREVKAKMPTPSSASTRFISFPESAENADFPKSESRSGRLDKMSSSAPASCPANRLFGSFL